MSLGNNISRIIIWGGLSSPLFFSNQIYAGYAVPKTIIFLLCTAILLLFSKNINFPTGLIKYLIGFSGILFITSVLGNNFINSLFSNPLRNTGALFYVALSLWIILVSQIISEDKNWKNIFGMVGLIGFIVALKGIMEGGLRPISTIGNPSEAAAYVLLAIWFLFYYFIQEKTKLRWVAIFFILPMVYYLYISKTRSAFFAFPFSIGLTTIYFFYKRNARILFFLLPLIIITAIGVFFLFPKFMQMGRIESLNFDRIGFHNISIASFMTHPILGIGLENFLDASYLHYDASLVNNHMKLDKAHSIFWEWMVSGGLLLFGFLAFVFYKLILKIRLLPFKYKLGSVGFISSYFFWGAFSIDNVPVLIVVATFIAFIISKSPSENIIKKTSTFNFLIKTTALGLFAYVILLTENTYKLSKIRTSLDLEEAKNLIRNINSKSIFPTSTLEDLIQKSDNIQEASIKSNFVKFLLEEPVFENKNDVHILNLKTKLLADIGDTKNALESIKESIKIAPKFGFSKKQMAVLYLQNNQADTSAEIFEKYIQVYPLDTVAKIQLAAIQGIYLNNHAKAFNIIKSLSPKQTAENLDLIFQIFNKSEDKNLIEIIANDMIKYIPWMRVESYALILKFYCDNNMIEEFDNAALQAHNYLLFPNDKLDFEKDFFKNNKYNCEDLGKILEFLYAKQWVYKE